MDVRGIDQNFGLKVVDEVPREDGRTLSYREFWEKYMLQNKPVVIKGLMENWRACKDWVLADGTPNLQFLADTFGGSTVQVADCGRREFTDQKRIEMKFSEFIQYWKEFKTNEFYDYKNADNQSLYLKDWHFVKDYPHYEAYSTPKFFSDDWLNLFFDQSKPNSLEQTPHNEADCSDYRFVYMGPKGTWTPLHADVFRSYSWSGNVCGKKVWYLLSPKDTPLLYDRFSKHTVYDISAPISEKLYPGFSNAGWFRCIQEMGDVIFVPSGWYHQVTNLENTISINHNWLNACNLHWVWRLLLDDYQETIASIEDIRSIADDFEELCQRNLAANSGMNFEDFFSFIKEFYVRKVSYLAHETSDFWQLHFDLTCIRHVLLDMSSMEYFCNQSGHHTCACSLMWIKNKNTCHEKISQSLLNESSCVNCPATMAESIGNILEHKGIPELQSTGLPVPIPVPKRYHA